MHYSQARTQGEGGGLGRAMGERESGRGSRLGRLQRGEKAKTTATTEDFGKK